MNDQEKKALILDLLEITGLTTKQMELMVNLVLKYQRIAILKFIGREDS